MPLSNLPGPWKWEKRDGYWWRVHQEQHIEDGPHTWRELNLGLGGFGDGSTWFDRDGEPIPVAVASELLGDFDYKVVKQDVFVFDGAPVQVSTVWLGLNHSFMPGPPKIFETMIFGGAHDLELWRYSTEEEALEGHAHAVQFLVLEHSVKEEGHDPGS